VNTLFARLARAVAVVAATSAGIAACTHSMSDPETLHLQSRLDELEHRRLLIEDANAIKRLQRGYGYYLDVGQWDKAADLFASDGTIEMGLDGVYVGQARVRAYLHALGGKGLTADQINQHMQLMPYVTVASDGMTAKATWRDVILAGHVGKDASWGEGPYENEYVKEHGAWKIKSLHWFQTLTVPYQGGWAKNEDLNSGQYLANKLPPDRPPTVQYRTWPGGLLPPFHFDAAAANAPQASAATPTPVPQSPELLARRTGALTQQVQLLKDQDDIENLQRIYGYYLDKAMWSEAGSLFADDAEYEIEGRGTFVTKARVLDYLRHIGPEFPREGRLYDQMQLQPIVHVAPDGRTAKGRWRVFIQAAQAGKFHEWGMGVAENEYVKDGDAWKIRRIHFYPTFVTPFEEGWGKKINAASSFEPALTPDRPAPAALHHTELASKAAGAAVSVPAFHYSNPVSGASNLTSGAPAASSGAAASRLAPAADTASLTKALDDIDQRIGRLEDFAQLENLQMRYGYYLATLEWDRLANLFASDGTIEIALRGVYVGRANIRRSLNLYGEPGVHEGNLHNHMQYQPVIHVAPDGKTARVRARAFSMMGNYGKAGMWMGGIYENQFVKENGVWKFQHDQVFNTYFTPFDVGWKDLQPRPPPGITATNPPDRPPTMPFEMYPKPTYWPAFHYNNPVTGNPTPIPRQP
jgi:hypothetical protein